MRITQSLTGGVDISATILDLANVEKPKTWDGVSLLPILQDNKKQVRTSLPHIQVWGPEPTRNLALLDGRYKYIYWYYQDEALGLTPTEELYDLQNDPFELTNIANHSTHSQTLKNMRKLYDQQIQQWQHQTLNYNEYAEYGHLLNRDLSWSEKLKILQIKGIADKS
ncbi:DUF4976 domain-containing protein [Paraglaciecola aquimarina]|uniref:DUF4976 domain-containing protein n=2 Tax=Paraglaciecola algarum TaxID=3050085 RepID=A0ABS9D7V1_9ALTE|nr:DUF4976 domain-containing protein [Paraglaciecola sp. G1-23]